MGETKNKNLTYDEYLELPDVNAADDAEKARLCSARREPGSAVLPGGKAASRMLEEFRQEILDSVWEHTGVSNAPNWGEWTPEYYIPRGHEKDVDVAIDAALARLLRRMEVV